MRMLHVCFAGVCVTLQKGSRAANKKYSFGKATWIRERPGWMTEKKVEKLSGKFTKPCGITSFFFASFGLYRDR